MIGTGGVGSAAMWRLARGGARVLGLDRFAQAHDRGSSHGQTRAIRQAYFEHPDYVPLLRRAYAQRDELEQETQQRLFYRVDLFEVGPADGEVIPGVLRSAEQYGPAIERPTAAEARAVFPGCQHPGFDFRDNDQIVIEKDAGYLLVEQAVRAQLLAATRAGVEWRRETVLDWRVDVGEV